jgi:hypothetical protein
MTLVGHVALKVDIRGAYTVFMGIPVGNRALGK